MTHLVVSGKEVIKALQKAGFKITRQRGSHIHLEKEAGGQKRHVIVPVHGNKDLVPFTLASIIRQSGYTKEEFATLF